MNKAYWLVAGTIITIIFACQKADHFVDEYLISFTKPKHFPEPNYNFPGNPISKEKFDLGKKLFYDPILSRDNTISCSSCHIPENAFTHHGHDVSHGIDDRLGIRNSMTLTNLAWSKSFFWDGGVFDLDLFSIAPIENVVEMDEKLPNVLKKLNSSKTYPLLFEKAFGTREIQSSHLLKALSQFMLLLVSDQSKYDQVIRSEAEFTAEEEAGYRLFQSNCNACHQEPLFTDGSFRDNGIGMNPAKDEGRFEISQLENDRLKFKVPTLRNLAFTQPYMHDGRFRTLESVINHYRREVQQTPNLDPLFSKEMGIKLSELEVKQLLAFLNTLNDETFIKNPLFRE
ncbi:c-type cytochrome [Sphingobacterium sp. DK4209]|uniref:C-type cytochrome n=1 Tax=Sphingobacterium zhuxiongii TaxID=2662364 RepID=A0A5Q0QAS0_9SPHI|nr:MULTISPECIES: cytochrome c peroxidase [unclassified Sphingobacterium]MVZ65061.1 c-type cytochrome [Sphingobacterium sp. DK4209]QGA26011.1 c-type cytochrome [Sphingobacterium sp. dk4302]